MTASLTLLLLVATLLALPKAGPQTTDVRDLEGEWVYFEDRTPNRAIEQLGPPMSATFSFRVEDDAVILAAGHGSGHRNVRVKLDGSITEVPGAEPGTSTRYRGGWKDNAFTYEVDYIRVAGQAPSGGSRREFRPTQDGLVVKVALGEFESIGIYRHAADIPMPTPAKAVIGDLAWLVGAWTGTRGTGGTTSIEERWSGPLGGAMLATSRTVSRGRMSAFEFLRIVERDGTLVYIAQPNGAAPTEFLLTEITDKRAVFENPRHDYPKRIAYELSPAGGLTATIGFTKGGTPRQFEFKRDGG